MESSECDWKFSWLDGHKGEYYYKCGRCGREDWFASYDRPEKNYTPPDCLVSRLHRGNL